MFYSDYEHKTVIPSVYPIVKYYKHGVNAYYTKKTLVHSIEMVNDRNDALCPQ